MYFPRNWEFGSALSKLRNFGGGGGGYNPPQTPLGTPLSHAKQGKSKSIASLFLMGNLGEGYRDAGERVSNTGAIWEALCLIASYCTANFPLLPVSNGAML
jgi:hypothetical protein